MSKLVDRHAEKNPLQRRREEVEQSSEAERGRDGGHADFPLEERIVDRPIFRADYHGGYRLFDGELFLGCGERAALRLDELGLGVVRAAARAGGSRRARCATPWAGSGSRHQNCWSTRRNFWIRWP